jgi:poly(rC)-binding protein 2/3/4
MNYYPPPDPNPIYVFHNIGSHYQISGAKVIVHEPRPGTSNRTTIILLGTPDETQAAQSLLQAYILNGSS